MIVSPGCFIRNDSASSAVTKSPAMNSPVPSMKKQRSASPSQAMPMSAFSAITRSTMSRRFSSMSGLDSWLGNRAVHVEAQRRQLAGRDAGEELRSDQAGHAAAGVQHDVEGLDRRLVDERHDVVDVVVEHVLMRERAADRRRRRQRVRRDHLADLADAGVAAQGEGLAPDHLDAVVLLRVVRRRDLHAAVMAVPRHGEIHHVGRDHPVVDDVSALLARPVDEGRRDRRRRQPHVACRPRSAWRSSS